MPAGKLIFAGWQWLWLAVAAVGITAILVLWSYRSGRRGATVWLGAGLKVLGVAALAACFLEPLWSGQRARPGANLFAVVVDNSRSLQITDHGNNRSRAEVVRTLLNPQQGKWQATLENSFELRRYFLDSRLQSTKDFSELTFDGRASALNSGSRMLADRFRGRPLAGVLLLTDGNATDGRSVPDVTGLPPVYPVMLGRADAVKDASVQAVRVSQSAFEDAPVSVQADVVADRMSGESVVAQILDRAGKKVAEQTLKAHGDHDTLAFRFQFRPETQGLSFYRLRARLEGEAQLADTNSRTVEATLANNTRVFEVNRGRGPYRILYVAGRPNWEFKFLNRAAQEDTELELVALIRAAKREPKFNFMGRPGETSNPLFRGFGSQSPDEVEHYDQPVLVRLNTRDELELRGGFPSTPEDLYQYQAVIVDDLEAEFFTPAQAALLQKFVSERGGGFLMLGGMECFREGKYQRTPIGDMLPVYLDRADDSVPSGSLHLLLTREGLLEPWARLRDNEAAEKKRLEKMAPFQVLNRLKETKPGATVVTRVSDESGKSWPALVVQRFGRGRTAALTVGDVWRWGLRDADAHKDMDKSWRQLLRWLVTEVPKPVEVAVERAEDDPSGAVNIQVRARDPKFEPLDNAVVKVEIQPVMSEAADAATNVLHLQAEPSVKEAGLYQLSYVPRFTGGYKATAYVTNSAAAGGGHAEEGWSTDLAADEFRYLNPNVSFLEGLAKRTGGEVVQAENLEEFARKLPQHHAPYMDSWSSPLWHTPAMLAFALACLLGEWGIRRWRGLA